jgi:hypothetical protein
MGARSPEEIPQIYSKFKQIFKEAGMPVREFISDCVDEIKKLPKEDIIDKDDVKLLGLNWNVKHDEFSINLPSYEDEKSLTRRKVLSHTAKPFDPLGFVLQLYSEQNYFGKKSKRMQPKN